MTKSLKRSAGWTVAGILCMALAGCSKGPGDTVKAFVTAMDAGKVDDAKQYLTAKERDQFSLLQAALPGGAGKAENKVDHVEIKSEDVQGDAATVQATIYLKAGGPPETETMHLVKEDGKWRLAM